MHNNEINDENMTEMNSKRSLKVAKATLFLYSTVIFRF